MGKRRKAIPCALCARETLDDQGVCNTCRRDAAEGRRIRQKIEAGEVKVYSVCQGWELGHSYGKADSEANTRIYDAVLTLAKAEPTEHLRWTNDRPVGLMRVPMSWSPPRNNYLMTPETYEAMEELIKAICDLAAYSYELGMDRGESFITRLANDEISLEQLISRNTRGRK